VTITGSLKKMANECKL